MTPMLIALCKKKTKNIFDENHKVVEQSCIKLDYTVDYRFIDANIAKGIHSLVNKI
jgi:hypothetical protein